MSTCTCTRTRNIFITKRRVPELKKKQQEEEEEEKKNPGSVSQKKPTFSSEKEQVHSERRQKFINTWCGVPDGCRSVTRHCPSEWQNSFCSFPNSSLIQMKIKMKLSTDVFIQIKNLFLWGMRFTFGGTSGTDHLTVSVRPDLIKCSEATVIDHLQNWVHSFC